MWFEKIENGKLNVEVKLKFQNLKVPIELATVFNKYKRDLTTEFGSCIYLVLDDYDKFIFTEEEWKLIEEINTKEELERYNNSIYHYF